MTELGPATPFTSALPSTSLFIARDREIEQITSAFASGVRLVLITGSGGQGKTTSARVFAERSQTDFPGGISVVSASQSESANHLIERAIANFSGGRSLVVIDDVHLLGESDDLRAIDAALAKHSQSFFVVVARKPLDFSVPSRVVEAPPLTPDEILQFYRLSEAIRDGKLDDQSAQQLVKLAGGNPALASAAAGAVGSGAVTSWRELFGYLRQFQTPGLIGPDGQPLTRDDAGFKRIVVDVSTTNSAILQLLRNDPKLLWELPPRKFEEIVADILEKQGYQVTLTPASGDGGFDVYAARKDGLGQFLYLVECKRYTPPNKVGVEIVRSLYGVLQAKRATAGAIVTTSYFTKGAESFQREVQHQMHLHDYIVLQQWIKDFPLTHESDLA